MLQVNYISIKLANVFFISPSIHSLLQRIFPIQGLNPGLLHCKLILYCLSHEWNTKVKVKVLVIQSCPTSCNPMDCSLPGSPVHGILQGRILEWVAISVFRRSSWPGIVPRSHTLQAVSLPSEPPGKPWLYSLEGSHHTQFKKSVVLYPIFFKDELSP